MNRAFAFGPFLLCPGMRTLLRDGVAISVGSRAFDILVALVARRGAVLSHRELLALAWPGLIVEDANLRVQIQGLRRSLGCARKDERFIVSVAGRGYCFVAPANEVKLPQGQQESNCDSLTGRVATDSPQAFADEYAADSLIPSRPGQRISKVSAPDQDQGGSRSSSIELKEAERAPDADPIILLACGLIERGLHLTKELSCAEEMFASEYKQIIPEELVSLVRYGASVAKLSAGQKNDRSNQHKPPADDLKRLKEAMDNLTERLRPASPTVH